MPAIQVFGKMGSNKTHFATFYALYLANKYKKRVVLNYLLHPDNLMSYCANMGYLWLIEKLSLDEPIVYYCDVESEGLDYILSLDNSIVVFDEVALYVPARGSGAATTKTSKFHKELTQIRHRMNYLICIAQNHQQIDSAIKNLAEYTFHCEGITFHDEKIGTKRLYYKIVNQFIPENYEIWVSNPRLKRNPVKTKLMSIKSFSGLLSRADLDLFNVYPSFGLVHDIDLSKAFPDSNARYYKQMPSYAGAFTWAYIEKIKPLPTKSKWFSLAYKKLPNQYFVIAEDIIRFYKKRSNTLLFHKPSLNTLENRIVLCILIAWVFLIALYVIRYGLLFILGLLLLPFLLSFLRSRRIVQ